MLPLLLAITCAIAGNAPADRYFGKLKMSAVRIRYEVMQLRPRYETHKLLPEETLHLAILDEDAFYAWAETYPNDTWLASSGYLLAQLFEELPGSDARSRAIRALTYVKTRFPHTTYGQKAAATLSRGVPVRQDPAWAAAMRASRASPSPNPSLESSAPPSPCVAENACGIRPNRGGR
jgi:hypothetical protein